MHSLNEIFSMVSNLNYSIGDVLKKSGYEDCNDLSLLQYDCTDPDQLFLLDQLSMILERLEYVHDRIHYIDRPVEYSGSLTKNSSGRYELPNGTYFTCGSSIECLIDDSYHEHLNKVNDEYENVPYWYKTSVEHDGNDYYLVGRKDIPLQGLTVRVRQ